MIQITYTRIASTFHGNNLPYEIRCHVTSDSLCKEEIDTVELGLSSLSEGFWLTGTGIAESLKRYLEGKDTWEYDFKYYYAWLTAEGGGVSYAAHFRYTGLRLSTQAAKDFVLGWLECVHAPDGRDALVKNMAWGKDDVRLTEPQTAWG